MSEPRSSPENLLINGAFLPALWTRLMGKESDDVRCPVDAQTFAADRWRLRYAVADGGAVSQAPSNEVPPDSTMEASLEIRGDESVTQDVFLGQTIEAAEAHAYRRELRWAAWIFLEHPTLRESAIGLRVSSPMSRDVFNDSMTVFFQGESAPVLTHAWTRVDFTVDAAAARGCGLCVELAFSAELLCHSSARVHIADAALWPAAHPQPAARSSAVETQFARRFFQRHNAQSVNTIGRALVCNPHELHFQFTFPEMRAFPAITLPQSNDGLTVFSLDGIPQAGFAYDVPYCARGSAIIRATKRDHDLRDGFLAFRGFDAAILLEAEL